MGFLPGVGWLLATTRVRLGSQSMLVPTATYCRCGSSGPGEDICLTSNDICWCRGESNSPSLAGKESNGNKAVLHCDDGRVVCVKEY